jgi:transposase InsO family protein
LANTPFFAATFYASSENRASAWLGGRCLDNIFIERLWRSLKYEEVYLKDYRAVVEARDGIGRHSHFYDHQCLGYRTPAVIYAGKPNGVMEGDDWGRKASNASPLPHTPHPPLEEDDDDQRQPAFADINLFADEKWS